MNKVVAAILLSLILSVPVLADGGLFGFDGWENDRVYKALTAIFGHILDETSPTSVVEEAIREYSHIVLKMATIWLIFISLIALVNSAKDAEPLGKSWSGTWGTVRVLGSFGSILPVAGNGFPAVMYLVLLVAEGGVGGGNAVLKTTVNSLADQIKPLSAPMNSESTLVANDLLQIQTCIEIYNSLHEANGWSGRGMELLPVKSTTDYIRYTTTASDIAPTGLCGELVIDFKELLRDDSGTEGVKYVQKVHVDAVTDILARSVPVARAIAYSSVHVNADDVAEKGTPTDEMASELARSIAAYDRAVIGTARFFKDEFGDKKREQFREEAIHIGWSGLSRFWLTISRLNGRALSVLRYKPLVSPPDWGKVQGQVANFYGASEAVQRGGAATVGFFMRRVDTGSSLSGVAMTREETANISLLDVFTDTNSAIRYVSAKALAPLNVQFVGLNIEHSVADNYRDLSFSTVRQQLAGSFDGDTVDVTPAPIVDLKEAERLDSFLNEAIGIGPVAPVNKLVNMGHSFIVTSEVLWTTLNVAEIWIATAEATGEACGHTIAGKAGVCIPLFVPAKTARTVLEAAKGAFNPLILVLFLAGIYFAFIIPFQVWMHYFLGVFGWIILVSVGVVASVLWMVIHISFKGDEFLEHRMIPGWMILLAIFMKPPLMVIGFLFSLVIFSVTASFIDADFYGFYRDVTQGQTIGLVTWMVTIMLQVLAYFGITKISFRLMTTMPVAILHEWMGGPNTSHQEESDTTSIIGSLGPAHAMNKMLHVKENPSGAKPRGSNTITPGNSS